MKKISIVLLSFVLVLSLFSPLTTFAKDNQEDTIQIKEEESTTTFTVDGTSYLFDHQSGQVINLTTNEIVGIVESEVIVERQFVGEPINLYSTNNNEVGFYYYRGIKIANHYVYSYTQRSTAKYHSLIEQEMKAVLISLLNKILSKIINSKVDYVVNRLLVIFSALPATNEYCSYVDVRRYADKNVLSSFANITEAIGPAPQYEFINIMSYDTAISR